MTDWYENLLRAFFEFREAHSYWCRYHDGAHYQDRVTVIEGSTPRSVWLLHGNEIASLWRLPSNGLELVLRTAGYPTLTTIARLNGILRYLRDVMGVEHDVRFWLKYNHGIGRGVRPLHAYVTVNGRKYLVSEVVMRVDPESRRLSVYVDESSEVVYVMEEPSLQKYRRIYKEIRRILNEAYGLLNELYEQRDRVDRWTYNLCFDLYDRVRNKMYDLEDNALVTGYAYDEKTLYGVYVRRLDGLMERLLEIRSEALDMLSRIREALAYAALLS